MNGTALPIATARQARSRMGRLLADRRGQVAVLLGLTGVGAGAGLAGPALIGAVVDVVAGEPAGLSIQTAAGLFAAVVVLSALAGYRAEIKAAVIGEDSLAEIRTEVFDHALSVGSDRLEQGGAGELVSRVTGDVAVLNRAVRYTVPTVFFCAVETVLTAGALALVHPVLAVVALAAALPAGAAGGLWYARHAPACYRNERQAHADLAAGLLQSYLGARVLTAYRAHGRFRYRLAAAGGAVLDAELAGASARNRLRPSVSAAQASAILAVLGTGAFMFNRGLLTIGAVSAAALYIVRLFGPVATILEELDELQQASASLARLVGITQMPQHRQQHISGAPALPASAGGLELELDGVHFGYRADDPVILGVDLKVRAGERVVIVGASGAGKSTLAKLIAGIHHPWSGQILVGGRPLGDLSTQDLVSRVALVDQDGHLFTRSVADNVALARPDVTSDEVVGALAAVDALDWVRSLPQGLYTLLGSGGYEPTAAQAQQVGLARVVCAGRPVVVLDEATADLDPGAAERAETHLGRALAGRTVITIAHRLDAASRADRVVLMEHGVITEMGPHHELVAAGGAYARLWERWQSNRKIAGARPEERGASGP
jgi:ABC-type multidrug transport system fused ATPase/permease subunit